jgi:thioredoxin 1
MTQILNDQDFEEVLKSNKYVLVDFFAEWCGPCKMLAPIIDELSEEYKDKIKIVKINVDESPITAQKFEIMSIPTLIFFVSGQIKDTLMGLIAKDILKNKIEEIIK